MRCVVFFRHYLSQYHVPDACMGYAAYIPVAEERRLPADVLLNVGSQETLVKIGKKLKKNNVAVDVVSFGEPTVNQALLEARTHAGPSFTRHVCACDILHRFDALRAALLWHWC